MTAEEMQRRYQEGEDPMDLVIEKWVRIRDCLPFAFTREDFVEILQAAQVPIPFCQEHGARRECHRCPIHRLCQAEEEESMWSGLWRLLQAYAWAGDLLPLEPLQGAVERFVKELIDCKREGQAGQPLRSQRRA